MLLLQWRDDKRLGRVPDRRSPRRSMPSRNGVVMKFRHAGIAGSVPTRATAMSKSQRRGRAPVSGLGASDLAAAEVGMAAD
jgi:hypothetical protein